MLAAALHVDGTRNTRAFGSPAWLIRSAHLDDVTDAGAETLHRAGATVVVDLREPVERGDRDPAHGLPVVHVPLYGLPDGPPLTGSLEGVADLLLGERRRKLAAAVAAIVDAEGAAVVHCAVGKDRTGLVVALTLLAAGATREQVVADYVRSGDSVAAERALLATRAVDALELDEAARAAALRLHLESPAEAMEHAIDGIEAAGGAARLLLEAGLGAERLALLRAKAIGRVRA